MSTSHRPPDCLHHVDGGLARLQERYSRQRRRIRALPEYADVQDAVRLVSVRDSEAALGLVTFGDRRGSVKVLKPVAGCGASRLLSNPFPHRIGLQDGGHRLAADDGVQEPDARLEGDAAAVLCQGSPSHRKSERHALEVVTCRGQPVAALGARRFLAPFGCLRFKCRLFVGFADQQVGEVDRALIAYAHSDDPIVRQPAAANGLGVGPAVQFDPESGLVVHLANHKIGSVSAACPCQGVVTIDARRGGLVDAVRRGKSVAVVAQRELPKPLICCGAAPTAAHSRGAVRLVADQHLERVPRFGPLDALRDALC